MAKKKQKDQHHIENKDAHTRMNFLQQASSLMLLATTHPNDVPASSDTSNSVGTSLVSLGRFYSVGMRNIASKLVMRVDPHVKRNLCRKCGVGLIPGMTSKVRTKRKNGRTVVSTTCLECQHKRYLDTDTKKLLFNDTHRATTEAGGASQRTA
ncbi:hypothetical protein SeMB42_g02156 [Synchytrium endobioticum]|uniref:Uncharacterized protein n=1 Tax=Synchytrium endobioticum TaxID=286115 RepID=A0A507CVV9_9FUNG|nr:hypothetical protein SeLEV6574_g05151 [Synchytrium endobioticum]TPX50737.1 hypothetical protein SeMB42_g02156 [Synchytrium endobioticum]